MLFSWSKRRHCIQLCSVCAMMRPSSLAHLWRHFNVIQGIYKNPCYFHYSHQIIAPFIFVHHVIGSPLAFCHSAEKHPHFFLCVCVLRHAVGSYFFVVCWRRPQFAYRCDFCCKIASFSWYGQCNPINQSQAVIVQANGIQKTSIFDCRSNCQQIFRYSYLSIWWLLVFRSLVQKPNYQQGCHLFRLFADNSRILSKCSRQ